MDEVRIETAGGLVVGPSWDAVAELHGKIAALAHSIGAVQKDGTNTYHGYEYVSYEQAAAIVKDALQEHGLSFTAAGYDVTLTQDGARILRAEASFTDIASGAMRVVRWMGEGKDSQDKGTAKAWTAAVKYGLMRMLLFADREVDSDGDAPVERSQPARIQERNQGEPVGVGPIIAGMPKELATLREKFRNTINPSWTRPASDKQQSTVASALNALFPGADEDSARMGRYAVTEFFTGKTSSKTLTSGEASAFIDWAVQKDDQDKPMWGTPRMNAVAAAAKILAWSSEQQGQDRLPLGDEEDEVPF